jgi:hypothetical protein
MDSGHFEFLKKTWAVPPEALRSPNELKAAHAPRLRSLRNGVLHAILFEIAGVGAIYGPVLLLLFAARGQLQSFHFKALFISFIGSLRLMGDLIKALRWIVKNDALSLPVLEHLLRTIGEQERWIRFYSGLVPISCASMTIFLLSDAAFLTLPLGWKAGVVLYLAFAAVIMRSFFMRIYGRRVGAIKQQFRDWTGDLID